MFKKSIPINITGGSYQSRTRPLSSQVTRNLYPKVVEQGKEHFVLHSFPGLKTLSQAGGIDRGMTTMRQTAYRVSGEKLYSFNSVGVHTEIGDIPGSARCIFANDGENLIICTGKRVYKYDGTEITTVTDANIIGSTAVAFLNNQAVYTNNNLFVVSDAGILDKASGLNAAGAESQPDDLIRAYSFQQTMYMFGERSVEPWWNTGSGYPPFARIDGQIMEVGCGAIHSIANTDEFLYWLGDDYAIYQASGGSKRKVSTSAISDTLSRYSRIDDAIGHTVTFDGLNFYVLSFPSAGKTWCLSESLGDKGWFEISSGTNAGIYQGSSFLSAYGRNYVSDVTNGNLYELDLSTYTNNSDVIQRRRVTSSVNGKLLGAQGARVQMSRLEILMETGIGLVAGQGEIPQIMIDVSYDGGKSWVSKGFADVGRKGESVLKVELFSLDSFYDAIFRITTSDPVPFSIYTASIDLRLAGW